MNAEQLFEQVRLNHDLIVRRSAQALEHLEMLEADYAHLTNEKIRIAMELNRSLAELYFKSNYVGAMDNSLAAIEKYKNTSHRGLIALHYKVVGHCYAHTGEFDLAERYLSEALNTLSPSDADYVSTKVDILHALAMTEDFKDENSEKITTYLFEAIGLCTEEKHVVRKANCLMGIGNFYNNLEKAEEALKYYHEAAETFEKKYALLNMASVYSNIGNCYIKLKDFDLAENYLNKSLELRERFGAPEQVSISYYNLAVLFKARNEFDKAEEFLFKTQKIVEETGDKPFMKQINETLYELALARNAVTTA